MKGWPIPGGVRACLDTLRRTGHAAYPVGGCVRDLLLGRTPGDFDVCTDARPERVMELFPHTVPTGLRHGTVTVRTEDGPVEVTTFRREAGYADGRHPDAVDFDATLAEDLARRDFTVNAMALSCRGELRDPFGGQADLAARLLRCVGDPRRRFREDALRILRALLDGKLHTAGQIAQDELLPQAFAYKILKKLEKAGLVEVVRGTAGGCRLSADLTGTSLYDLMKAMGERGNLSSCMDPAYQCPWRSCHGGCTVHCKLAEIQNKLDEELRAHSLQEILTDP